MTLSKRKRSRKKGKGAETDLYRHAFAICAYGESPFLEDCISSLQAQSRQSRVIMATSTPCEYQRQLAQRHGIRYYVNPKKNCGIAEDWNYAMRAAGAAYVTLAHQDDLYGPDYTKKIMRAAARAPEAQILFTDYAELRPNGIAGKSRLLFIKKLLLLPMRSRYCRRSVFWKNMILAFGNPISCPTVTYCIKDLPFPLFEGNMGSNIDWQAWHRLAGRQGAFVYVPEILMQHRIHRSSTTSKLIDTHKRTEEDLYMFRQFWPERAAGLISRIYRTSESSNRT